MVIKRERRHPSAAEMKRTLIGIKPAPAKTACEMPSCHNSASWRVTFGALSFHWCKLHTFELMSDADFWMMKVH